MDELVTVFGGGGFLGRYVAQELLARGARVRVAQRDPTGGRVVKPLSGLGQSQTIIADVTDAASVMAAARGSSAVINLVGILSGNFDAIHVDGARNVAAAAKAAGAKSFVQLSAIGADPAAESGYAASKGRGEQAVREAFGGATIIRPSILFGREDMFVNRLARLASLLPVMPVIRGDVRFQPAWVVDVARAIAIAALDPLRHGGETYELGGPQALSMADLTRWTTQTIGRTPRVLPVPDPVARAMARFGGWLPGAPITWDQWLMLAKDNVVASGADGFAAFGIDPMPLAAVAPSWLVRYRRHGRFADRAPA
jgi:NADH dehydrogenase